MSESEIQSDESSTAEEAKDNDVYKENRLLLYVVIFITGAALIYWSFDRAPESLAWYVVREFGKGLILTVLVSAGIGWLINRQSRRLEAQHKHEEKREAKIRQLYLESQLDGLAQRIEHQTRELADSSATIEALRKASIIRLYENRRNASDDIKHALEENDVDEVRIMAISMNNFLATAERTPLYEGWNTLVNYIKTDKPPTRAERLLVRVLMIDPRSKGARLRSVAESRGTLAQERLENDLNTAIGQFSTLMEESKDNTKVTFEVRLYRTTPTLFLVSTPSVSFIQQYYFRDSHDPTVSVPVISVGESRAGGGSSASMHSKNEIIFHFDWIWDNAAVGLRSFLERAYGVDRALLRAKVVNAYYDPKVSRDRLVHLIKNPENGRIWIKGISLRSFFEEGADLYEALRKACLERDVDVRILVIDPESEQARYRSYREYKIRHPGDTGIESYPLEAQASQRLSVDTRQSLEVAGRLVEELGRIGARSSLSIRKFKSAPEAFLLLTDQSVLVEQYHYGRAQLEDDGRVTLEGEVPVLEYAARREGTDLDSPYEKHPYRIFKDHFKFVFEHCSEEVLRFSIKTDGNQERQRAALAADL